MLIDRYLFVLCFFGISLILALFSISAHASGVQRWPAITCLYTPSKHMITLETDHLVHSDLVFVGTVSKYIDGFNKNLPEIEKNVGLFRDGKITLQDLRNLATKENRAQLKVSKWIKGKGSNDIEIHSIQCVSNIDAGSQVLVFLQQSPDSSYRWLHHEIPRPEILSKLIAHQAYCEACTSGQCKDCSREWLISQENRPWKRLRIWRQR